MLREEIQRLKNREECVWKQRSPNAWLKEGDSNSWFFHCRANQRNHINFITGLEDNDGVWREDEGRMGGIIKNYFKEIYTASNSSGFEEILSGVHSAISEEDAGLLDRDFQASEVRLALDQMIPLTAPGPDGMSPIFYKSFWHIVGRDVTSMALNALNSGVVPESLNSTFIALIPKVKHPKKVADFHPIRLCNVVYKLISKVLVDRLKKFLASAIPETQSAFLSGRLISDNVLVAFETLHYLKRKTNGKVDQMALKLDMSKVYDRVEWEFLEQAIRHLGLGERMVSLIMSCISTVFYSVLLNGQPVGNIKPSRGLRQGDPLSPYLFLMCAMGLQSLLNKAEMEGHIRGVAICRNGPKVSLLFFADDNVLFCSAKEAECQKILDILAIYERGSGQKINQEKTNIFFSTNTPHKVQVRIQQVLGVPSIRQFEKFLGLSALVGRAKKQSFIFIKERVWKNLQGWKEKLLSQAGREVLIKSVIQAIPTYTMCCFKLLKGLVRELESMIRNFWWGYSGEHRKTHWVKWERLCEAKEVGGLGFKEIEKFIDALLAKQVWRMINNIDSLCHRVFKARFFPNCSISDAKESSSGSYTWKSIIGARDVIRKGMVWRIGTGEAVRIKEDRWLPGRANCSVISPLPPMAPDVKVSSLIDPNRVAWRTEVVQQLFLPHEADIILGSPLSTRRPDDRIIWAHTPSGTFTSCSAYKMLVSCDISTSASGSNPDSQKKFWKGIWQLRVPNKIRHFVWRMCNNALPTLVNLHRRNIVPSPTCGQCHNYPEDSPCGMVL